MTNPITSRRQFLYAAGAAGAAMSTAGLSGNERTAVAQIIESQEAFLEKTNRVRFAVETEDQASALRGEYLLDERVNYLNHASIGTIPRAVHDARQKYLKICEQNPWLYMWGGAWDEALAHVRARSGRLLGCVPEEVAITHNTTEMFNTLAHGLPLGSGDEVLFSTLCHIGASQPFVHAAKSRGYAARGFKFPVSDLPNMGADDVVATYAAQIRPQTRLLVVPHIDNTVGIRYPVRQIARMARDKDVEFIAVDAAQSVGMIDVDVKRLGIDVLATSPHKWLQAPKGLGLAFVDRRLHETLQPMWVTWGQDRWPVSARRYEDYGTRNLAEALSLGDAIEFHSRIDPADRQTRLKTLWQFAQQLAAEHKNVRWKSSKDWQLAASLYAIEVENRPSDQLAKRLFEDHGVIVRAFDTLGLNTLRISPNVFTSKKEIESFFELATA